MIPALLPSEVVSQQNAFVSGHGGDPCPVVQWNIGLRSSASPFLEPI